MNYIRSILGSIALVIYSVIAKYIMFLLVGLCARVGMGWVLTFFGNLVLLAAVFSAIPYFSIVNWTKNSRFSVTFSAIVISAVNILNALGLIIFNLDREPVLTGLQICVEIAQIIFVIWVCVNTYNEKKHS